LLFALGLGSAWAATELGRNEVKSKHIKNKGVKAKDLADDAVTSAKVADGSLLEQDFAPNQLPQGEQGPQGIQGEPGAPGATNVVTRTAEEDVASGAVGQQIAECLPGEVATGGGVGFNNPNNNYVVMLTEPLEADNSLPEPGDVPTKWLGRARNEALNPVEMQAWVLCASP
jgi:hypothetical protein